MVVECSQRDASPKVGTERGDPILRELPREQASAPDLAKLLFVAEELSATIASGLFESSESKLTEFIDLYRAWIIPAMDMSEAPDAWAERSAILLHLMASASTLGESLAMLARYTQRIWGPDLKITLEDDGDTAALIFDVGAARSGPAGLICGLWPLTITLSELEFLSGSDLSKVRGRVPNEPSLPDNLIGVLFGRPLEYKAAEAALLIPKAYLDRPVIVSAQDIPAFLNRFIRSTIRLSRGNSDTRTIVFNILWNAASRGSTALGMHEVAKRIGCSSSTLRRRLHGDGVTFQALKDDILDRVAKTMLRTTDDSVTGIAEHLGYSDGFAFRRWFKRRNGISPRGYRSAASASEIVRTSGLPP